MPSIGASAKGELVVDAEGDARVAPQVGRLDRGAPGGEDDLFPVDVKPDRIGVGPPVGADGRERGGPRRLQQEGPDLLGVIGSLGGFLPDEQGAMGGAGQRRWNHMMCPQRSQMKLLASRFAQSRLKKVAVAVLSRERRVQNRSWPQTGQTSL